MGTSLAAQRLRLCVSTSQGMGSIPGQGAEIPHAAWWGQKDKDFRGQGCLASSLFPIQSRDFSSPALIPSLRVGWCSESSPSSPGFLGPPHPFSRCAADCRRGGGVGPGGGEASAGAGVLVEGRLVPLLGQEWGPGAALQGVLHKLCPRCFSGSEEASATT